DYDAILKNNPKDLLAVNNLAVLLADKKGDPKSLEKAYSLSKDFEKSDPNPVFLDTLGWVYVKLGRGEDALRVLKSAVAKAPKEPNLNYHLGMAYYGSGRLKDAKIYLTKALQSGVSFNGLKEARETLTQIKG
ncbi:MAG: tetratricopeptide repeat protein, partial [Nitrospiria bacterium]